MRRGGAKTHLVRDEHHESVNTESPSSRGGEAMLEPVRSTRQLHAALDVCDRTHQSVARVSIERRRAKWNVRKSRRTPAPPRLPRPSASFAPQSSPAG